MAYGDLPRRAASDKVLHNKAFKIAKNPKYDGYIHGVPSMVYKCFDNKFSSGALTPADKSAFKSEVKSNQHPSELGCVAKVLTIYNNQLEHYTSQLLENLKNEKYTHVLKIVLGF